jgi:hypothetical protein
LGEVALRLAEKNKEFDKDGFIKEVSEEVVDRFN